MQTGAETTASRTEDARPTPGKGGAPMIDFKKWFRAAIIRAVKTVAQSAIATIGTSAVLSSINWYLVLSTALLAGLLSLLTSIAGLPEVDADAD